MLTKSGSASAALGPISPQAMYEIEQLVGAQPNVHVVPIVPPGDVDACVKRFVAGETDDRLDGVMVVSLPTDKFQTKNDQNEATFSGSYEIWVLNLSTLAEDRHAFTFEDSEPVVGRRRPDSDHPGAVPQPSVSAAASDFEQRLSGVSIGAGRGSRRSWWRRPSSTSPTRR